MHSFWLGAGVALTLSLIGNPGDAKPHHTLLKQLILEDAVGIRQNDIGAKVPSVRYVMCPSRTTTRAIRAIPDTSAADLWISTDSQNAEAVFAV